MLHFVIVMLDCQLQQSRACLNLKFTISILFLNPTQYSTTFLLYPLSDFSADSGIFTTIDINNTALELFISVVSVPLLALLLMASTSSSVGQTAERKYCCFTLLV